MKNGILKISFVLVAYLAMVSAFMPWYSDLLQSVYRAHAHEENYDSFEVAEQAVSFNPFSTDARFSLAEAQLRLGAVEDSKKSLFKATELEPLNYYTWERLAYYEAHYWHQTDDARIHFQRAIELNPQDELLKEEAEDEAPPFSIN